MEGLPLNFQEMLQTAQQMQEKLKEIQEGLAHRKVEGSAGGGMVVATVNGRQELVSIAIDPEIVDAEDVPMLQDLVVAAVNQGLRQAGEMAQQEMAQVTGGLPFKIPGLT